MSIGDLFETLSEYFAKAIELAEKFVGKFAVNLPGIDPVGLIIDAVLDGIIIALKNMGFSEEEAKAHFHKHVDEVKQRFETEGPLTGLR